MLTKSATGLRYLLFDDDARHALRPALLACTSPLSTPSFAPFHSTLPTPPTGPDAHGSVLELCRGARLLLVQGQSGRTVRGTLPRVAPVDLVKLRILESRTGEN